MQVCMYSSVCECLSVNLCYDVTRCSRVLMENEIRECQNYYTLSGFIYMYLYVHACVHVCMQAGVRYASMYVCI